MVFTRRFVESLEMIRFLVTVAKFQPAGVPPPKKKKKNEKKKKTAEISDYGTPTDVWRSY